MRLEGKKHPNPQVQQSFIKKPDNMTKEQKAAYARLKILLGFEEKS